MAKKKPRFREWTYKDLLTHHTYDGRKLSVDAFVCSCGGKYLDEIETFLCCIRARHPDNPIYMMTDAKGASKIQEVKDKYNFDNITIWEEVNANYAKRVKKLSSKVIQRADYWNIDWIYAKMDALLRAIELEEEKGVLMLDSDIILNKRMDEEWDANVVMSPHTMCNPLKHGHKVYGFFNAGMFLTNRSAVVRDWINLFLKGGPDYFYEQTPMEDIVKRWVTEYFPESHNFGQWRREDVKRSNRIIHSFHKHPTETVKYPEQKHWWDQADKAIEDAKAILSIPHRKLVVVGKHDKSTVSDIGNLISHRRETEVLDGYYLGLDRKWHQIELVHISKGNLHGLEHRRNQLVFASPKSFDVAQRSSFENNDWKIVKIDIDKYTVDKFLDEFYKVRC